MSEGAVACPEDATVVQMFEVSGRSLKMCYSRVAFCGSKREIMLLLSVFCTFIQLLNSPRILLFSSNNA